MAFHACIWLFYIHLYTVRVFAFRILIEIDFSDGWVIVSRNDWWRGTRHGRRPENTTRRSPDLTGRLGGKVARTLPFPLSTHLLSAGHFLGAGYRPVALIHEVWSNCPCVCVWRRIQAMQSQSLRIPISLVDWRRCLRKFLQFRLI